MACSAPRGVAPSSDAGEGTDAFAASPYGCRPIAGNDATPAICDLANIAFRVTDLGKARAFYGGLLGLAEPFQVSSQSPKLAVYKINDTQFIELYEEVAAPGDTNYQLYKMAFSTSDAEALRLYFASKNVPVPPATTKNVLGNTSFTVTDPDGHIVEWVHYETDSLTGATIGQAMPDTRIGGAVHHLGVTIQNAAASDAFYQGQLGFVASSTADKEAARVPGGATRIEYGVTHSAPTKDFALVRDHLCLRVAKTSEAIATIAARDPSVVIEHHVLDGFTVRANVYDPDGTRIELADSTLLPSGEVGGPGDVGDLDAGMLDAGMLDAGMTGGD